MAVTNFVWDELSDNVLMEVDDAGSTIVAYTNEPNQFGELVSQRRGVTTSYFNFDAQGSTRQVTDQGQQETDNYTFTAFGDVVTDSGATVTPYRYKGALGYYWDSESNELSVRRRVYNSDSARWLSGDPLPFLDASNLYLYCHNVPVFCWDPSGALALLPMVDIEWKSDNLDTAFCGDLLKMTWTFKLNNAAPCDGYIVQKVDIYCRESKCENCEKILNEEFGDVPSKTIWEACYVKEKSTTCYDIPDITDSFHFPLREGHCGREEMYGEMRFFCKSRTRWGPKTGNLGGFERNSPGKDPWTRGGSPNMLACGGGSFNTGFFLWHDGETPDFWEKDEDREGKGHYLKGVWHCCNCLDDFVQADGEPKKR